MPSLRTRRTAYAIVAVLVLAITGVAAIYLSLGSGGRTDLRIELAKALLQLGVVGVVGGFVTWLLSERSKANERAVQERDKRRERQEALNELRRSAAGRLVSATNAVRRAPLLIESHRSKKTYGEQMRGLVDVWLDLSLLRHEQESAGAFARHGSINKQITAMQHYLDSLIKEWRDEYRSLPDPPADAWDRIQALPALEDLRDAGRHSTFTEGYLHPYREALRLMREEIFAGE